MKTMTKSTAKDDGKIPEKDSQSVKVAVHIRPLIPEETLQGCKDCVAIPPGEPQVQIGNFGFTFDHVYGSTASPSSRIFEECVVPLVDGLFNGYNATVLAYGQTGSGKTYTMGTCSTVGSSPIGIIPQVMDLIFRKIERSLEKVEHQLRVSFIEILNEEVYDLMDPSPPTTYRPDMYVGAYMRPQAPAKTPIQIRESISGGISLAGVTEIEVNSYSEMAKLLEQGSSSRATASTNMNSQSSRSHAIFTITLRQMREPINCSTLTVEDFHNDLLCAKLHLVDLAGSERVKRTGTDGIRFKEGVNINKGLLALGNVISVLGDEKKRKDGAHVPYRDSKLTRLLQDSLGGNSRTLMIACISPADSNAEETLNTLKYANRARKIQNKPIVNRDPVAAEILRMREQLELLQSELLCIRAGGGPFEETHVLKQKITWLEANNAELRQELQQAHDQLQFYAQRIERDDLRLKLGLLQSGKTCDDLNNSDGCRAWCINNNGETLHAYATKIQDLESDKNKMEIADSEYARSPSQQVFNRHMNCSIVPNGHCLELQAMSPDSGNVISNSREDENEVTVKELEYTRLQDSMDKELRELNERLEQKEVEMKMIMKLDNTVLKQQFERKLRELEDEKLSLQAEKTKLLQEIENLAYVSEEQNQKIQESYAQKLKDLEYQLARLKGKQESQAELLKQKLHNEDTTKKFQEEILRMKSQKVQLQQRIKHESESFRIWKGTREKELLQLRKERRRNEHEMLKLQALNQRQKMVLQRKTEEAAMTNRRLKDVLEARNLSVRENCSAGSNAAPGKVKQVSLKSLQQSIDRELEVALHIHEVRSDYEKQTELRASLARQLEKLRQEEEMQHNMLDPGKHQTDCPPSSLAVRRERSTLLKSMLDTSSNALVAMASELSEVQDRQSFSGPGFLQHLQSMQDAKTLLQYMFNIVVDARCQVLDKNMENRDLKENVSNLNELLKQSEAQRREVHQQQHLKKHAIAKAIAASSQVGLEISVSRGIEDSSTNILHSKNLDTQELHSTNNPPVHSCLFDLLNLESQNGSNKVIHKDARIGAKLGNPQPKKKRSKRRHEQWLLRFKWRWQKPWRLSEWIRHGDESLNTATPSRFATEGI